VRECSRCGKPLEGRQRKFCSKSCCGQNNRKTPKTAICEGCGIEFEVRTWKQRFCTKSCASSQNKNVKHKDMDLNRPYTTETRYLIKMWYNNGKGNSKVEIAQILGRSLESVEKAFV